MNLGRLLQSIYKHIPRNDTVMPEGEVATVGSSIFLGKDWPTYNPDELIRHKGSAIYKKMMNDEQIKAVTRFRRDATTGRQWFFEIPENEGLAASVAQKRIELFEKIVDRIQGSWKSKLDTVMSALHYGYSITEKVFEQFQYKGKTWIGIHALRSKPYETFYFYLDTYGRLDKFVQRIDDNEIVLDYSRFIHHVQNADYDEFYGRSELREAYRAYFSKDMVHRFWNIFLERYGSGFVVAKPTGNKTFKSGTTEFKALQDALTSIRTNTAMIMPANVDIDMHQFIKTDAYENAITQHDKAIAKALLMPNMLGLSEVGPSGSRALGDTQLEAFLWILDAESQGLQETLNEQLFKHLGVLNYGDDSYPRIKFKPLSETVKQKLINTWKDLVQSGAVEHSETDEQHVREMLGFPDKPKKEDDESTSVNSTDALTGVQITSMLEIVNNVAKGAIPRETGVEIIAAGFPVSVDESDKIMGEVGKGFKPEDQPKDQPKKPPNDQLPVPTNDKLPDETVKGATLNEIAFSVALKRVNFNTIDKNMGDITRDSIDVVEKYLVKGLDKVAKDVLNSDFNNVDTLIKIKLPTSTNSNLKKAFNIVLKKAWLVGIDQAEKEIKLAKKKKLSIKQKYAVDKDDVFDYIAHLSHLMSGSFSSDVNKIIANEVAQGVNYSIPAEDVRKSVYRSMGEKGLISEKTVRARILEELKVSVPLSKMKTLIHTATFNSMNIARKAYFTDDDLEGFVEAFQYSAIMDSRTTPICSELDGRIFDVNSAEWKTYVPPNHFNCRSLIIPVTEDDMWEASESPNIMPNKGFE